MDVALWIVSGLAALAFLGAGLTKLANTPSYKEKQPWAQDWSLGAIRTIGALEVLGALGLVLPPLTGIAPGLAVAAALGLVLVMVGGIAVHIRREEYAILPVNLVLLALPAFVFVVRLTSG